MSISANMVISGWEDLAAQIAAALYGQVRRQVRLTNGNVADVVVWDSRVKLNDKNHLEKASRIIECKLGARPQWDDVVTKYRQYCTILEVWCLNTRQWIRQEPWAKPPRGVVFKGTFELLQALLMRGRGANTWVADWHKRRDLAQHLWEIKWTYASSAQDLIVCPKEVRYKTATY